MSNYQRLALLTDEEVIRALNGVLKVYGEKTGQASTIAKAETDFRTALLEMQRDADLPQTDPDQLDPKKRNRVARAVLVEMSDDPRFTDIVTDWLENSRPTLFEPITAAIVMTTLTLVLSLDVKVSYEEKDGKKHLKVTVEKKPTSTDLISKILGVITGGS